MIRLQRLILFALLNAISAYCNLTPDLEEYSKTSSQSLLWAPYRANCYFGLTPRYVHKEPFVLGAMWFNSINAQGLANVRHFVEQGDKLDKYGWVWYDPRIGGKETITDSENNLQLNFTFVKSHSGENWAVQVEGDVIDRSKKAAESIVIYMKQNGKEDSSCFLEQDLNHARTHNTLSFKGFSNELKGYTVSFANENSEFYKSSIPPLTHDTNPSIPSIFSMNVPDDQLWKAKDIFQSILKDSVQAHIEKNPKLSAESIPSALTIRNIHNFPPGNVQYIQQTFSGHFKFEIIFNKDRSKDQIEEHSIDHLIGLAETMVQQKFDRKFNIPGTSKFKEFAQETFSNLLGGLSYFHGTHLVDRETSFDDENFEKVELKNSKEEGPFELFSMVPSRAFFPRGFYWDEGFHLLQLLDYDSDLAFEVLHSWFDLIDSDGWIPREVILGDEARSKVPVEFRVQNPNIANPPTLLLAFSEMLSRAKTIQEEMLESHMHGNVHHEEPKSSFEGNILSSHPELLLSYAQDIYPKLLKHFEWFRNSQKGMLEEYLEVPSINSGAHEGEAYRWIGRTVTHCLPSGMDDYPRAIIPDSAELHVDALTWVGVMTRSMKQIASVLDLEEDLKRFTEIEQNIVENLVTLHWDDEQKLFCDITFNDDATDDEDLREFVCHEGYLSLLPFAVKLIPHDDVDRLQHILNSMSNEETLLTPFGLRSLSKQDEFYDTAEVYWRGPIWLNLNYLCLDALQYYFSDSPLKSEEAQHAELFKQASKLYRQLRQNIITNTYSVWKKDGYVYEQYNHKNGNGSGVQHFTGWTALVVNMIGRLPEDL
ncbi:unnamed protein product [Kluyveromyces dobzhanskii CBS 2104]|uniref:Mannosyl-oligosaccharide glucosidase n=1 Tax=Kluyveromyces dobzhanskii CBS 2104 TaxID=1427455 RepID=A0A0A8L974_9SACH|nr:unnamed protein product [Kluyveromyces dobzhanskii CBS 2104]